jgi:hypothetical protein
MTLDAHARNRGVILNSETATMKIIWIVLGVIRALAIGARCSGFRTMMRRDNGTSIVRPSRSGADPTQVCLGNASLFAAASHHSWRLCD